MSLCVIKKPQEWEGHDPRWAPAPQGKKKLIYIYIYSTGSVIAPNIWLYRTLVAMNSFSSTDILHSPAYEDGTDSEFRNVGN